MSEITGPISTVVFQMENSLIEAGMGASGFVEIIETLNTMGGSGKVWLGILILSIGMLILLTLILRNGLERLNG